METENKSKNAIVWIVVGVIVVAVIVYLALSGGFTTNKPTVTEVEEHQEFAETTGVSDVSEEGEVLNAEGTEVAQNDAIPGSPQAPQESMAISPDQLPSKAIEIKGSPEGWTPNTFTVKAGAVVTLGVSSEVQTHVFAFRDPSLQGVAVGIGPGETRAITFNAPDKKGEYQFYCNVPGHADRGEVGVMIVE